MSDIVLAPQTKLQTDRVIANQSQSLLIVGPHGVGKTYVAKYIASELLSVDMSRLNAQHGYVFVAPENKTHGIESIRTLQAQLKNKLPNPRQAINRVVIIDEAEKLTEESQNALLKTLEEPPTGTLIILTTHMPQVLLPTITSRLANISVSPLSESQIAKLYASQLNALPTPERAKILTITSGRPALCTKLIVGNEENQLIRSIENAKRILRGDGLEKLSVIKTIKDRNELYDLTDALLLVLSAALKKTTHKQQKSIVAKQKKIYNIQSRLLKQSSISLTQTSLGLHL